MNYKKLSIKSRDLNNEGKFDEAIEVLESIREEGKKDLSWYYRYAYSLTHTNKFKKAIDMLEEGIRETEDKHSHPFGYLLLGQLYYWQGKLVDAFKMVEKGKGKCKNYDESSLWEFDDTLKNMYLEYPFMNPEDWRYSVLGNIVENYDENIDSEYKIVDSENEKEKLAIYFGDYERERASFCVNINVRLQPKHRFNFEDDLGFKIFINRLGVYSGGGTLLDKDKRACMSDMSFDIYKDVENYRNKFFEILESEIILPRGSYVDIFYDENSEDVERVNVGKYDVLAVGLDAQNLPDEVYKKYDLAEILEGITEEFEKREKFLEYYYYDETEGRFWIRFLGENFEEMQKIVREAVGSHPLFQNAEIINETYLNQETEEAKILN